MKIKYPRRVHTIYVFFNAPSYYTYAWQAESVLSSEVEYSDQARLDAHTTS